MVTQFSLGNYKSFNSIQSINFNATGLKSDDENKTVDENNIVNIKANRLLKTIGVYGANASGKSNLIKGLLFFRDMVADSLNRPDLITDYSRPFRSSKEKLKDNGYFQIILVIEGKKYRYGFTLGEKEVASEWLFGPADKNETKYFTRKGQEIEINKDHFHEGLNTPYESSLRSDALFLSFCASYNGSISKILKEYISDGFVPDHVVFQYPNPPDIFNYRLTNNLAEEGQTELILDWLRAIGLVYNQIEVTEASGYTPQRILVHKNVYDNQGDIVDTVIMDFEQEESTGSNKFYTYIGMLNNLFKNGGLLISDEIDSNLHPSLLMKILGWFNNPQINKANAQLLFTSHDTNLMNPAIMRRDQFYFTEKSTKDETNLYSLSDLKGIRNNADFARQYLAGFYGALPILGNYLEESSTLENSL